MIKKISFIFLISLTTAYSQNNPVNFEIPGTGQGWSWTVFENDDNPSVQFVANPDTTGINKSKTAASFTARINGQPWAGCESNHGTDIGPFSLDSTNCIIKIMVYKNKISDVGIKLVDSNNAAMQEIKVSNTVINEWEELIFDFSTRIGLYPIEKDQIVIFPDFDLTGRTKDEIIYFDNVLFEGYIEQQTTWSCINSSCLKQNNSFGQFTDSVTCVINCIQTDIKNSQQVKRVIKIYDLLGVEVKKIRSKGVFFYLYSDGTIKKVYSLK